MINIALVGGGGGTRWMAEKLRGECDLTLSLIQSVFDNGGHTGLVRERGHGALGDLRRGIVALADPVLLKGELGRIFCGRFKTLGTEGKPRYLDGASMGNLLMACSLEIRDGQWSNLPDVIKWWSTELGVRGHVLPVSLDIAEIHGWPTMEKMPMGTFGPIRGETQVEKADLGLYPIASISIVPYAKLYEGATRALREAHVIVFCAGSRVGSGLINTRVGEFSDEVRAAKKRGARLAAVTNLTSPLQNTYYRDTRANLGELATNLILDEGELFDVAFCNIAKESLDPGVISSLKETKQVLMEFKGSPHVKKFVNGNYCSVNESGGLVHNESFFKAFLNWVRRKE